MKKIKLSIVILFTYIFLITISSGSAQELSPEQIYEKVNNCVVVILSSDFHGKQLKQGSGVVISEKGWVVTNYHVFAECEKMEVKHNDKIIKYTDIIGVDVEKDILILKIDDNTFPSIAIGNSDNLKVGQRVYAIGSPLGLENSMSEGIVSGLRNIDEKNKNYIQVTTSISSGSSGGAIVNTKGELIGISTMTLKNGQNLNFAIPINDILSISIGSYSDIKYIEANNSFYIGYNAMQSENLEAAIVNFNIYISVYPKISKGYFNRGLCHYNLSNFHKAILDFTEVIVINPVDAEAYMLRGVCFLEGNKEYSKAISDFNIAIELNPGLNEAYYNRGLAFAQLNELNNAVSDLSAAIILNPTNEIYYYERGNVYLKQLDYSSALIDYNKAIIINPSNAISYYIRGSFLILLKDYINALLDLNATLELDANYAAAYFKRGIVHYYLNNYSMSLSDYTSALQINPELKDTYFNRGLVYNKIQLFSKSILEFSKALKYFPKRGEIYFHRGISYYNLNDLKNACSDWQQAYNLGILDANIYLSKQCK